jgi:hypothetical protein
MPDPPGDNPASCREKNTPTPEIIGMEMHLDRRNHEKPFAIFSCDFNRYGFAHKLWKGRRAD